MFKTLKLPATGMAVTIDIGEARDIHPKNKQEVGRRLSLWALGSVYGGKGAISGPRFTGSTVKDGTVVLAFSHTDGGLVFKGAPKGFVIAGEDQKWTEAEARIEGDTVVVSSPAVARPVAVRYAWHEMPPCTLWNGAGLPASPFRTDVWELTSFVGAAQRVKVACVGDSITAGVGAKDRQRGPYPAQLQGLLGTGYEVRNFGVSGSTLLRSGDKPYDKEPAYQAALDYKPDLVILKLGTNDSKPQNWAHKEDFIPSAQALVAAFRKASPRVRIYVCLPVPAFPENFTITDKVIKGGVIPELRQFARAEKLRTIDLYTAMKDQAANVPDKVHPNDAGYRVMAETIAKVITAPRQAGGKVKSEK
jgi:lysophospholipase L1-like esterase